jgi:hypothetical protein
MIDQTSGKALSPTSITKKVGSASSRARNKPMKAPIKKTDQFNQRHEEFSIM